LVRGSRNKKTVEEWDLGPNLRTGVAIGRPILPTVLTGPKQRFQGQYLDWNLKNDGQKKDPKVCKHGVPCLDKPVFSH
jgi:hypothetical protein